MFWLTKLAISLVISYLSSEFFGPSEQKRSGSEDANSLDQSEVPTAEMGKTIPVVFGSRWITSPNVVFWRKSKTENVGAYRKHFVDMHMAVCHGPVDAVRNIGIDKKLPVMTAPVTPQELLAKPSKLSVTMSYVAEDNSISKTTLATWAEPTFKEVAGPLVNDGGGNNSRTYLVSLHDLATSEGYTFQKLPISTTPYSVTVDGAFTIFSAFSRVLTEDEWDSIANDSSGSLPLGLTLDAPGAIQSALNLPAIKGGKDGEITIKVEVDGKTVASKAIFVRDAYLPGFLTEDLMPSDVIHALTRAGASIRHVGETYPDGTVNPLFTIKAQLVFDAPGVVRKISSGSEAEYAHVTQILDYQFEELAMFLSSNTLEDVSGVVPLGMPTLFGGYKEGGGIEGELCVVNGDQDTSTEVSNTLDWLHLTSTQFGGKLLDDRYAADYASFPACRYRSVVSAILKDTYVVANAGSIRPWHFGIMRSPNTLPGAGNYSRIGMNANAACVLYEVLTNKDWGKGFDPKDIQTDTFVAAARTLHGEGLGISIVWNKATTVDDFLGIIAKHAFGTWRVDIFGTGKVQFHLFRDYQGDISDLHVINPLKVGVFKRKASHEVTNEVQVKWKEYTDVGDVDRVAYARNMAHIHRNNGAVNATTMVLGGIADEKSAKYLAQLNLDSDGYPLAVIDFTEDLMSGNYLVGDHIVVDIPKYVSKPTIFRVTDIRTVDTHKSVIAIEDVFVYTSGGVSGDLQVVPVGILVGVKPTTFRINPFRGSKGEFFLTSVSGADIFASLEDGIISVTASINNIGDKLISYQGVNAAGLVTSGYFTVNVRDTASHNFSVTPESVSLPSGGSTTLLLPDPSTVRAVRVHKEVPEVSLSIHEEGSGVSIFSETSDYSQWSPPYQVSVVVKDVYNAEAILNITIN